jgi:Flagellar C1a complex subunit C1a-32
VSEAVAQKMLRLATIEEARDMVYLETSLLEAFSFARLNEETREIILDFHCINLKFCLEQKFDPQQVSAFLGLMTTLLTTTLKTRLDLSQSMAFFKQQVLLHSTQFPPMSMGVFSLDDTRPICEFALDTFFRHFANYQYVFVSHLLLKVTSVENEISN